MSPAHSYDPTPLLTIQRGGLAPTASPTVKMHPSEIALTLSADVLRLKCTMNARAVLAEIVSFHAATGLCDASDSHFAARLSISLDTVSRAIKELEAEGLVLKVTTRVEKILYRTLTPKHDAIAAKATANPYPQNQGTGTRKMPEAYPQNQGTGTRKIGVGVPAKSVGNTPLNLPISFQVNTAASAASAGEEENEELSSSSLPTQSPASHTEGGATDVATSKPKPVGPRGWVYDPTAIAENLRLPFASSEFRAAWVGYRTYREEQKHRRLSGGMMEQQQLDKLAQLAAGEEATALALIAQTIAKGWQDFYPLDKPRTHASAIPTSKPGTARHHVPVVSSYGKL